MAGFQKIEDLEVWKRGCRIAVTIYKLTDSEPFQRDWGMRDQMRRAAVSIPSNIAEGFERSTPAEFNRFSLIAKGSCGELRTQLFICQAIGYLKKDDVQLLTQELTEISSMIRGLSNHLKKDN